MRTKNEELAQTWKKSEQWATIEQLCSKRRALGQGVPQGGGGSLGRAGWGLCGAPPKLPQRLLGRKLFLGHEILE